MMKLKTSTDHTLLDQITLNQIGVNLDDRHKFLMRARLSELNEKLPNLCSINLTFSRYRKKIKGHLSIKRNGTLFFASAIGKNPLYIFEQIESEIIQQVLIWKKQRNLYFLQNIPSRLTG